MVIVVYQFFTQVNTGETMKYTHRTLAFAAMIGVSLTGYLVADKTGGYVETDLVVNQSVNGVPTLEDANGIVHIAKFFDPHLVNPWGVGESSTSFFWVADNWAWVSTLYNTAGTPQSLVVSIPAPDQPLGTGGAPTGVVFNTTDGFRVSGLTSGGESHSEPAVFLFATEDGAILGWHPTVNPPGFNP